MDDQYETIGAKYKAVKLKPSVAFTEVAAVVGMLGDLDGKRALDLACGAGFYSRLIRRSGASYVLGVDMSRSMIDVAEAEEAAQPLGVEYRVADVATMPRFGAFDIVTAVWLLHYARTPEELQAMCRNIGRNLIPGGRLIAILPNPVFMNALAETEFYDYRTRVLNPGESVPRVRMDFLGGEPFSIEYAQWPFSAYEEALRLAGFVTIKPVPIGVSSQGVEKMGAEYWRIYLDNPIAMGLVATFQGLQ